MRVTIASTALARITAAAEAGWPDEACGLLVGRAGGDGGIKVLRAIESANLAATPDREFEIDPRLWLDLRGALEDSPDDIVGLFHSHPGATTTPSARDLADAWGGRLAWLITAVADGHAAPTRAYVFRQRDGRRRFDPAPLDVVAPPGPPRQGS